MKNHLEKKHGKKWYDIFIDYFDSHESGCSSFSEYELYMMYLTEFAKVQLQFVSNANITVHRNFLNRLDQIIPAYVGQYKSISMHHFIKF